MPTRLFNFPLARHSACKLFEKIFHARELPPFSSFFYFYYFIIFRVTQRKLGPLTRPEGAVFCLFVSPSEITRLELDEESDGMKTKKKKIWKKKYKEGTASERAILFVITVFPCRSSTDNVYKCTCFFGTGESEVLPVLWFITKRSVESSARSAVSCCRIEKRADECAFYTTRPTQWLYATVCRGTASNAPRRRFFRTKKT